MVSTLTANPWLVIPRPNPQARLRLFCFPYAGGAATIYRTWADDLPRDVEVVAVQPPGRGARLFEPAFKNLVPLVEAVREMLLPELDKPFAFFGHSMGAMISFELARALRRTRGPMPSHLFLSGRRAPQIPYEKPNSYDLPDDELIAELRELKGTASEVLDHAELMQLMLPLIRADFEVVQSYLYVDEPPLECPITALGAVDDLEDCPELLEGWREQTSAAFSMKIFPGDHFYLQSDQATLLARVSQDLKRILAAIA